MKKRNSNVRAASLFRVCLSPAVAESGGAVPGKRKAVPRHSATRGSAMPEPPGGRRPINRVPLLLLVYFSFKLNDDHLCF